MQQCLPQVTDRASLATRIVWKRLSCTTGGKPARCRRGRNIAHFELPAGSIEERRKKKITRQAIHACHSLSWWFGFQRSSSCSFYLGDQPAWCNRRLRYAKETLSYEKTLSTLSSHPPGVCDGCLPCLGRYLLRTYLPTYLPR